MLENRDICPLCSAVLHEDTTLQTQVEADAYPDIAEKTKLRKRVFLIGAYFAVLAEVLLIVINYLTFRHLRWSMITGVAMLYLIFTLRELSSRRKGHIRKLYYQAVAVFLLLVAIDFALGFQGWSVCYGLPCILLSFDFVILLCMLINFSNWQNYVTMQIFMLFFSLLYLVISLTGVTGIKGLAWVTFGVCLVFWTTTMIIGGRKAENEVRRKFHL